MIRPAAVPRFSGLRLSRTTRRWTLRLATLSAVLLAWEIGAADINEIFLTTPSRILISAYELTVVTPDIWLALAQSLGTLALGLMLTLPVGIVIGLAMGRSRLVEYSLDPYVTFLYVLPGVSLIPLLVLWFGFDLHLRIVLVFLSAVFPLIVNTMAGVKNVDQELLDSARSFGATEFQRMRTVILPASMPFMVAGFRIAFSSAWVGVIVAEMTALLTGIGGLITIYANFFQTSRLFVPILFIMAVGLVFNALIMAAYRLLTPWQEDHVR